MCDIIVVGSVCVDVLVSGVDTAHAFKSEATPADGVTFAVGGDAINEATSAAKLGASVRLITGIGDDLVGEMVCAHMHACGLRDDGVTRLSHTATSVNVVVVDKSGERRFLSPPFADSAHHPPDVRLLKEGARVLSLASLFTPPLTDEGRVLPLAKRARELGMTVCADMNMQPDMTLKGFAHVLPYIDYLFPNTEEAAYYTGEKDPLKAAEVFASYGVGTVVAKLGAEGCCLCSGGKQVFVPGYPVERVIDTTGAGDNFAAGFTVGLAKGMSAQECAKVACAAGAIAVTQVGATTAIRNWEQLETLMRGDASL